jgi:hypothetical protein
LAAGVVNLIECVCRGGGHIPADLGRPGDRMKTRPEPWQPSLKSAVDN